MVEISAVPWRSLPIWSPPRSSGALVARHVRQLGQADGTHDADLRSRRRRFSVARARNIRTLLVQLLGEAVTLGLASEHVAKKVRSQRVPRVKRRTLTPAEMSQVIACCDARYSTVVALYLG